MKKKMLAVFEYRGLDILALGEEVHTQMDVDSQAAYDTKNPEVVMLIKLLVTNELLLEVQDGNDAFVMQVNL